VPYFAEKRPLVDLRTESPTALGLRECQIGAYWAVKAHFTMTSEPALVSLPTGSGKTALMQILAFGLGASRVLVIEPSTILRDQVAADFETLETLKKVGVVPQETKGPKTIAREGQLTSAAAWKELAEFDVVVATPHTTSPEYNEIARPPADLFDVVFIDEAHHTAAPTWTALLNAFERCRRVLLTATPFRRDKRRLQAPLIYSYPLSRALEANIYRPVKYHAIEQPADNDLDAALCSAAKKVLRAEDKLGNRSKLLVRTDRVKDAGRLVKLYKDNGVNVEQVDYSKSLAENEDVLARVRKHELHGIVCVGMVGEGLDLPELKIAVLHHAPRSLPFTLQFVGRVARVVKSQVGDAHLIASPDEVRGEVRKLYHQDADWRKLIPKLIDRILGKESHARRLLSSSIYGPLDIDPVDLKPFHSVRVYRGGSSEIDLDRTIDFPVDIQVSLRHRDVKANLLVMITETERVPGWAIDTGISQTAYDLHIYYQYAPASLLFEYTSSDEIGRLIREQLASADLPTLKPGELLKAMAGVSDPDYLMVGLRNATGLGPAHPTYKTFMGTEVQAAIRPSDARVFAPGHALARVDDHETRGIASANGRVWSIRRSSLPAFIDWCEAVGKQLARRKEVAGLPQIDFLARPVEIKRLDERPLTVSLDDAVLRGEFRITVHGTTGSQTGDVTPSLEIEQFNQNDGTLLCGFVFSSTEQPLRVKYSARQKVVWQAVDGRACNLRLDFGDDDRFEGDLEQFFMAYPPIIVCPKRGVVIGTTQWLPNIALGALPSTTVAPQVWTGTDIQNEAGAASEKGISIQDFVQARLIAQSSRAAVVVKDHGTGELADFIVVDAEASPKSISFYHCKSSRKPVPSDRVGDFYEVLEQAARSAQWCRSPRIMEEIVKHTGAPRSSPIVKGRCADLENIAKTFRSNEWTYQVVAVQPGCDSAKLRKSKKVYGLVVAAYQWLLDSGGIFSFWSS
jgi:superfamily II DNA or RNA helicase